MKGDFIFFGVLFSFVIVSSFVWAENYNLQLSSGEKFEFQVPIIGELRNSAVYENHEFLVKDVRTGSVVLEFRGNSVSQEFAVGDEIKVDVNKDGTYDLYIKLNSINGDKAGLYVQDINEVNPGQSEKLFIWTNSKMKQEDLIADEIISGGVETGQVIAEDGGSSYAELGAASFFVLCIFVAISFVAYKRKRYKDFGY
jgi:hypothetical protein